MLHLPFRVCCWGDCHIPALQALFAVASPSSIHVQSSTRSALSPGLSSVDVFAQSASATQRLLPLRTQMRELCNTLHVLVTSRANNATVDQLGAADPGVVCPPPARPAETHAPL